MNNSATTLLLGDIIQSPSKAESILESLTAEQIIMIESTIDRVKRRKMDKSRPKEDSNHAIANALAAAMVSAALQSKTTTVTAAAAAAAAAATSTSSSTKENHDPVAEIKNGVEWVSFLKIV
ncbi:hypothetical protein G6F56_010725 [Rhizopus delemar]|nr:hypothetical protein G6F56_010725 [Rhizopus delemar]